MNKDQENELRRVQDMAVNHAIEEMDAAGVLSLKTKEQRGDRFWLAKMATQSLTVASRIEAFIMLRNREGIGGPESDEDEDKAINRMVSRATDDVARIIAKAKKTPAKG